jgi:hypothetical protein
MSVFPIHRRALVLILSILAVAHVAAGLNSAKRFVYLLKRFAGAQSDAVLWRAKALRNAAQLQRLQRETPTDATLWIHGAIFLYGENCLLEEAGFYTFPRRVCIGRIHPETCGALVDMDVTRTDDGEWHVEPVCAGTNE